MPSQVDVGSLAERVAVAMAPAAAGCTVRDLRPLGVGASGLTYVGTFQHEPGAESEIVVKVAPAGLMPRGHRDVGRQYRLLRELSDVALLPVPRVLAIDEGAPPELPPLFVMERVPGAAYEPLHDVGSAPVPAATIGARARAAARALAQMRRIECSTVSAEPVTTLQAEIEKWSRAFHTVDHRCVERADACAERLRVTCPAPTTPALVHGDYRLGNMVAVGDEISAVVDWEVWTRGDPRLDLAWYLNMLDPSHPGVRRQDPVLPPGAELVDEYIAAGGGSVEHLSWFTALVRFRQAAMSALIGKHARQVSSPDPRALEIESWVMPLLTRVAGEQG